jgi:hypothetical protein
MALQELEAPALNNSRPAFGKLEAALQVFKARGSTAIS